MRQRFNQNIVNFEGSSTQSFYQIVGELYCQDRHYLIVSLENSPQGNSSTVCPPELSKYQNKFEKFEINGQFYGMLEADLTRLESTTHIASLLSGRELQIATLVALGRANKQIARQLHISEWTVSTYLRRIFAKLGVDSRAAMVYHCAPLIQSLNALKTFDSSDGTVQYH